jgi:hypothetical protein
VVVLLGVVERAQVADVAPAQALEVQEHARGDERPGQTAPPGLIGSGDEATSQPAVVAQEAPTRG